MADLDDHNGEIESYLTLNLVVGIAAECEYNIQRLFSSRAARRDDMLSQSFVFEVVGRTVRSLKTSELAACLSWFGSDSKAKFVESLGKDRAKETAYNNLIENRNLAAHGESMNMTFEEVVTAREAVVFVMDSVSRALTH
ncbi:MAG: hypothetical protein L3K23_06180 [Thermoplasmata archaeon]|nr:hypothetical protein [Thermoplasmata archaeon]